MISYPSMLLTRAAALKMRPGTFFVTKDRVRKVIGMPTALGSPCPSRIGYSTFQYMTPTDTRSIPSEGGRWEWSSRAQDHVIENFSYSVLADLSLQGMVYNTRVDTRRQKKPNKDLCEKDLCCFPWLIVEHKKADTGKEQVLCQAANASMAALMITESLARYAEDQEDNKHVVPITSITTVGKDVSVWVTYLSKAEDGSNKYVSDSLNSLVSGDTNVLD